MIVFISTPDALINKSFFDESIRVNNIPAIYNNGMRTS